MALEEELRAFDESCAYAELPWSVLRFTGPDRRKFLNGLLTNDVAKLPAGRGLAACLLTPKGMLRAHFVLYDHGDALWSLCPAESAGNLTETLGKMIMLSESKLEDLTGSLEILFVAGPKADAALGSEALQPFEARSFGGGLLLSWPRLRDSGRLVVCSRREAAAARKRLEEGGARAAGPEAFEALRVDRGFPLFGKDMGEDTIPLEARLEDAISFDKGCYMGQETISRVHNLGHLNKVLVQLKVSAAEPPSPGAMVLREGKEIGRVTSAAPSPRLGAVAALATVKVEAAKPGTVLGVASGHGSHRAEVVG